MPYGSGYQPMMGWGDGWHWFAGLHGIVWFLLLVAVLVAVVALIRYLWRGGEAGRGAAARTALAILEERYARGEIDREEYLQKKKDLA